MSYSKIIYFSSEEIYFYKIEIKCVILEAVYAKKKTPVSH